MQFAVPDPNHVVAQMLNLIVTIWHGPPPCHPQMLAAACELAIPAYATKAIFSAALMAGDEGYKSSLKMLVVSQQILSDLGQLPSELSGKIQQAVNKGDRMQFLILPHQNCPTT